MATDFLYADAAAHELVARPELFDVLVMGNFLSDVLSDLGAAPAGGSGMCGQPTSAYARHRSRVNGITGRDGDVAPDDDYVRLDSPTPPHIPDVNDHARPRHPDSPSGRAAPASGAG